MRYKASRQTNINATVYNYDVADTPSLIGYFPCDESEGSIIHDRSQYGNHLTLELNTASDFKTPADSWAYKSGFLSLDSLDAALVYAKDTVLNTRDKIVVASATIFFKPAGFNLYDFDMGTSHAVNLKGFSLGAAARDIWFRVNDGVTYDTTHTEITVSTHNTIAGAFIPAGTVRHAINGGSVDSQPCLSLSVSPEDGFFGFQCQPASPFSVKNYQLWAFDTLPPDFDSVLSQMSMRGGALPYQWVGL